MVVFLTTFCKCRGGGRASQTVKLPNTTRSAVWRHVGFLFFSFLVILFYIRAHVIFFVICHWLVFCGWGYRRSIAWPLFCIFIYNFGKLFFFTRCNSFSYFLKCYFQYLPQWDWEKMDWMAHVYILMMLILPIQERGKFPRLLMSSTSF